MVGEADAWSAVTGLIGLRSGSQRARAKRLRVPMGCFSAHFQGGFLACGRTLTAGWSSVPRACTSNGTCRFSRSGQSRKAPQKHHVGFAGWSELCGVTSFLDRGCPSPVLGLVVCDVIVGASSQSSGAYHFCGYDVKNGYSTKKSLTVRGVCPRLSTLAGADVAFLPHVALGHAICGAALLRQPVCVLIMSL